ncbi:L-type lectin-domain containing receptor kinase IX.1-like isoform X2 [Hordeum vulgare subsp. vulgare]|uniref:L-type lectin-domain containing receptor kinase IX.1-like isoform X2 n=1 Tax=Hordeum vulgare subsp. vulgare TaxID=112509 RepID=UPI000B465981|nr:L-type lectin-domain containing receptor kinase IX.1-like isoform X2 [Hordeum vulgare subsp. vulgare]
MVAMGLPATASRGSAQLLPLVVVLLASLHFSGVKSLDVTPPPASSPTSALPLPAAVASPFSFSFDFTNASTYRMEDLEFEGSASATVQDHLLDHHVDVTCSSYGKDPTHCTGRVSYAHPVPFYDNTTGELASFQTRFTFAIVVYSSIMKGDGMAFFLACYPSKLSPNSRGGNLGLINSGDDGNNKAAFGDERFVAVEFDTFQNPWDSNGDHIGIDINSVTSVNATILPPRSSLNGTMTATVTFDNTTRMLVAELQLDDDDKRNLRHVQVSFQLTNQLNTLLPPQVAVGFSAATGSAMELHRILSWSFNSSLAPPRKDHDMRAAIVGGSIGGAVALVVVVWCIISCFKWTRTTSHDFVARTGGARRFEYSVLAAATDDFSEERVIGQGAFGVVYRGTFTCKGWSSGLPSRERDDPSSTESSVSSNSSSKEPGDGSEVAVKKILKETRGGNLDFFAEMNTISEAKHKNLVKLKGWCCRENNTNLLDFMCWCCRKEEDNELFLVYELVPNGNLHYHLHESEQVITWPTRYQIVKGIGSALVYLHHECDPYILHRDIKPGNILLDNNFNAKLADFELSRVGNQDNATMMTLAQGTEGYIDPECRKDGKVKFYPRSDVYSFGIVLLDIVCTRKSREQVWELYKGGKVIEATDERLHGDDFDRWQTQMQRVAVLGLWCSLLDGAKRPTIQKAMEFLERDEPLPNLNYAVNTWLPSAHHDAYTSHCSDEQTLLSDLR